MDGEIMDILRLRLEENYKIISVIKEEEDPAGESMVSCLLMEKAGGRRFLAKCVLGEGGLLRNEWDVLSRIHQHSGEEAQWFPEAVAFETLEHEGKKISYLIRSWIEGSTLEALVESQCDRCGLPRTAALQLVICVAEEVAFLHEMKPPVLHRDIKPQNVVVDRCGMPHLIDFGISRVKDAEISHDTLVAGTCVVSPPEQFGYQATDERSDVYALGMLLRYTTCGDYEAEGPNPAGHSIQAIVERATRFDPEDRYPTCRDMLEDLYRERYPAKAEKNRGFPGWAAACVCLIMVLCIGGYMVLGHRQENVRFREPLLEEAVRTELGKMTGEITQEDLAKVTGIHIFGEQIYHSEDDLWQTGDLPYFWDSDIQSQGRFRHNGGIVSLEDIRMLPNLRELCVYNQKIEDLSPLKGMKLLGLGIGFNPVRDISPLEGMPLRYLHIGGLDLADADALATLKDLTSLNMIGTDVQTPPPLQGLGIRELSLSQADASLAAMVTLRKVTLALLTQEAADALALVPLEDLTVLHAGSVPFSEMGRFSMLSRLSFYGDDMTFDGEEPVPFPHLRWLDIKHLKVRSLKFLSDMPEMKMLHIYELDCKSYEGLEELKGIELLVCNASQKAELEKAYPSAPWRLEAN